jgi:hypothetical protein
MSRDSYPAHKLYTSVHAVLISWASDGKDDEECARQLRSMHEQLCQLRDALKFQYAFQTEEWQLTRDGPRRNFTRKLADLISTQDEKEDSTLLILYYAGHGAVDNNMHLLWRW